jgi:hypothetical protein
VPKPFTWGIYGEDGFDYFWGEDSHLDFLQHLSELPQGSIVYFHNGGKFDIFFLLDHLDEELTIINGRISKCTLFNGRIELRDSYLILPLPLSAHDKDVFDYTKMEVDRRNIHKNEIIRYLTKDCKSLYEWVLDFIDQFGVNLTLAGTAFKQLKEKTSYIVTNTYDTFDDKFRKFYYGGRVQCFKTGYFQGPFQYVDINSAYPRAMLEPHFYGGEYLEHLRLPTSEHGSWFAKIDAVSHGALPCRDRDGSLFFPDDGEVRTFYASGHEINTGLDTNTLFIKKVHYSLRPMATNDFSEYVNYFYRMKREAEEEKNKNKRQFAKLMLNSCYGKFGQDGRNFEKFIICEFGLHPKDIDPNYGKYEWNHYADTDTGHRIYSRPDPSNQFYNVATAASITGWVRAFLWRSILRADDPHYCDTDSIICRGFNGEMGKELGQWSTEAELLDVAIAQKKMYAGRVVPVSKFGPIDETKTASKGVRLNYEEIKQGVISGENIVFYKDAPAFSLKYGPRFFTREVNFSGVKKLA